MGSRGRSLNDGGDENIDVRGTKSAWGAEVSTKNQAAVEEIAKAANRLQEDFANLMQQVQQVSVATLGGRSKASVLGYYGQGEVAINDNFLDVDKMNAVYGNSRGFHPPRGNLTGTEAVALHEMGHALTDLLAKKMGAKDLHDAAKKIVQKAYRDSNGVGGTDPWARNISGYARKNYAEAVAEAVADFYSNGNKAAPQSKAIVNEMKRIQNS